MTWFEWFYRCCLPVEHPLYQRITKLLARHERQMGHPLTILDVGGRRSNYTIGLRSRVTITDIPRESELQRSLDLGATDYIRQRVLNRRSNVAEYLYDDMTKSRLPSKHYDVVVSIEVLEHVEDDVMFVKQVARVLKPGGYFFMTTPNGDFIPTPSHDHKRHYRLTQLRELLLKEFDHVDIEYAVNAGPLMQFGIFRPALRRPIRSVCSTLALGLSYWLERMGVGGRGPVGKWHLVAIARLK